MWIVVFDKNKNGIYDYNSYSHLYQINNDQNNDHKIKYKLFVEWKDAINYYIDNYHHYKEFSDYKIINQNLTSQINKNYYKNVLDSIHQFYPKFNQDGILSLPILKSEMFKTWKEISNQVSVEWKSNSLPNQLNDTINNLESKLHYFYLDSSEYLVPKWIFYWTSHEDWRIDFSKPKHFIMDDFSGWNKPCNAIRLKIAALIRIIKFCFERNIRQIKIITRSRFFDQILDIWFQHLYSHQNDCKDHRDLFQVFYKLIHRFDSPILIKTELQCEHFTKAIYNIIPQRITSPFYHLVNKILNKQEIVLAAPKPKWTIKDLI